MIIGKNPLIAMAILPYLVPDSRCKPELEKILQLTHVGQCYPVTCSIFYAAVHRE